MTVLNSIYRGDTKQYRLILSKGTDSVSGKLESDLSSGELTEITVNDCGSYVPAKSGHIMITNKAGNTETIPYTDWSKSGEDYTLTVNFSIANNYDATDVCELDGGRVNITGATFTFSAKKNPNDTTSAIEKSGVISNATAGELTITLEPSDTDVDPRKYYYDIEMTNSDGDISTLASGTVKILQDITTD